MLDRHGGKREPVGRYNLSEKNNSRLAYGSTITTDYMAALRRAAVDLRGRLPARHHRTRHAGIVCAWRPNSAPSSTAPPRRTVLAPAKSPRTTPPPRGRNWTCPASRAVIKTLMTITLRSPGMGTRRAFDPATVQVTWRRPGEPCRPPHARPRQRPDPVITSSDRLSAPETRNSRLPTIYCHCRPLYCWSCLRRAQSHHSAGASHAHAPTQDEAEVWLSPGVEGLRHDDPYPATSITACCTCCTRDVTGSCRSSVRHPPVKANRRPFRLRPAVSPARLCA